MINVITMVTMIAGTVVGKASFDSMDKCTEARDQVIAAQHRSVPKMPTWLGKADEDDHMIVRQGKEMQVYCIYRSKKVASKKDDGPERVFGLFEGFLKRIQEHEKEMQKGSSSKCASIPSGKIL